MRKATPYTGAKDRCLRCMSLVEEGQQTESVGTNQGKRLIHADWEDCSKALRQADLVFTRSLGPSYRSPQQDPYSRPSRPLVRY